MNNVVAQERINDLHADGKSYMSIAGQLKDEGIIVSHMAVKRYLDSVKVVKEEVISHDSKLTNIVKERIFDASEQLREITEVLQDLMKETQITRKFKVTVIKELRDTIKLADTIMNDFKNLNINQGQQSKMEMIQLFIGKLNELEDKGDIKILNPALKTKGNHQQDAVFTEKPMEEEQK
jgi:hypothetical protein